MKDTIIKGNGMSRVIKAPSDIPETFVEWRSQLVNGTAYLDVSLNADGCDVVGTAINKNNLLSDSTKEALELTQSDPTVNNALYTLAKAAKSTLTTKTLSQTGWTGDEPPYTYSLSVSGVTTTSVQEILPTTTATEEQIIALQAANMQDGGQSVGKITIKAWGDKPEIDLPVRIIIRGDL